MSEKHLTELPWKSFVMKQKLKDPGLGKALAEYGKCGESDHDGRLKALDAVEKEAGELKKANKDAKEVKEYIDEVLAEAGKARKSIEALKKTAEAKGGGANEEDSAVDEDSIKKKMVSLLGHVRALKPEDPQLEFMAGLAAGASAVLLAKKAGSTQKGMLLAMMPGGSGPKFLTGSCIWEENAHTFVLDQVPGGLAKKLQAALFKETGQKYKVRVRSTDGLTTSDSDTEEEAKAGEGEQEVSSEQQQTDLEAKWKLLKASLVSEIKKVIEKNPPNRGEILKLAGEGATKEKAQDFAGAITAFEQLRPLLGMTGAGTGTAPQHPPDPKAAMDGWHAARATVIDQLKKVAAWVVQAKDPQAREGIILLQSVIKNLTENPGSRRQVAELQRYLQTDEVIDEVQQAPSSTGLTVHVREPLLSALSVLETSFPE